MRVRTVKRFATAEFASSQVSFGDSCQSATASASSQLYKGAGKCEGRYVADAFEEISLPVLHGAMCGVRATGRCFCPEAIHLLEARAQIRCAIRCERWYRNRRGYFVGECGARIGAEPSPSEELSITAHCPSILCHRSSKQPQTSLSLDPHGGEPR